MAKLYAAIAAYKMINQHERMLWPTRHRDRTVIAGGPVLDLVGDTIQVWTNGTYEAVCIALREELEQLCRDSYVTAHRVIARHECFGNTCGAETCRPAITDGFLLN